MFDIGWTEMLVIAVIMIVVVGPKDLPKMLRTFGQTTKKLRSMAGDFQKQFNDALKEAELDDVKKSVDALRDMNPTAAIKKQLNPFEKAAADVRSGLDSAMKPKPADRPASAEPLKSGTAPAAEVAANTSSTFPAMDDPAVAKPASTAAKASKPAPAKSVTSKPASPKPASKPAPAAAAAKPAARPAAAKAVPAKAAPAKPASVKANAAPAKAATPKKKPAGPAK